MKAWPGLFVFEVHTQIEVQEISRAETMIIESREQPGARNVESGSEEVRTEAEERVRFLCLSLTVPLSLSLHPLPLRDHTLLLLY